MVPCVIGMEYFSLHGKKGGNFPLFVLLSFEDFKVPLIQFIIA
jgi:hypothetical protein